MGSGGIAPQFLVSAVNGGEWSASHPGRLPPEERAPGAHWLGGCVGLRAGLDSMEKRKHLLPCARNRPLATEHVARWYTY
jgi:hypothetical protein